jgi:hypothetical protein
MKHLKKLALLPLFCGLLLTVACKDDNDKKNGTDDKIQLLETITFDGQLRVTYEYDEQNRLTKMFGAGVDNPITFTYTSNGITIVQGDKTYEYVISGNKITCASRGETIDLDAQGLPTRFVRGSDTIIYEFKNGNVVKQTNIEGTSWFGVTEYTYDDKKSPFYHCKTSFWFLMWWASFDGIPYGKNNMLTASWGSGGSNTFTFTYDENGFPLSYTTNEMSAGKSVTYTYIKK